MLPRWVEFTTFFLVCKKKSINEVLDVKYYETPKNNVHVTQLQRIAQIEDLSAKYIRRKGMNPIDAINAAAEALMIDVEEPRLSQPAKQRH